MIGFMEFGRLGFAPCLVVSSANAWLRLRIRPRSAARSRTHTIPTMANPLCCARAAPSSPWIPDHVARNCFAAIEPSDGGLDGSHLPLAEFAIFAHCHSCQKKALREKHAASG